MKEVKPRIEVAEKELKEREAREKEYLERKRDYGERMKALENEELIESVASSFKLSPVKLTKFIADVSFMELCKAVEEYGGEPLKQLKDTT